MLLNLSVPLASMLASAMLAIATAPEAPEVAVPELPACPGSCAASISWVNPCNCGVVIAIGSLTNGACDAACATSLNCKASLTVTFGPVGGGCGGANPLSFSTFCLTAQYKTVPCPGGICVCAGPMGSSLTVTLVCLPCC